MRRPILISVFVILSCFLPGLASAEDSAYEYSLESQDETTMQHSSIIKTFSKKPLEILASMIELVAPATTGDLQQLSDISHSAQLTRKDALNSGFRFGASTIEDGSTGIGLHYYFH